MAHHVVARVVAGFSRRRDEGERRKGARRGVLVELALREAGLLVARRAHQVKLAGAGSASAVRVALRGHAAGMQAVENRGLRERIGNILAPGDWIRRQVAAGGRGPEQMIRF